MKNNVLFFTFTLIVFILFLCGLNCAKSIKDDLKYSSNTVGDASYWLDPETSTVHKMITINENREIVSIIRYSDGIRTEVMEIIKSEIIDDKVNWAYYVPSTGYTVEMKVVSFNSNKIIIKWKNRDANGETDSGDEVLVRCEENGTDFSPRNDNMLHDTLYETDAD